MKKFIFLIAFFCFSLAAMGQNSIIDYATLWAKKQSQIRLEVAIHTTAANILNTPADSIYARKAVGVVLSSNLDSYKRRYTREAINREVNPDALSDTQLTSGIRALFIKEFWGEKLRDGEISATQYYTATQ